MNWLAIDIGGANIKLADGKGYAAAYQFAMWKEFRQLPQELRTEIAQAPACDHLAITMTGELADCFENRATGVKYILQAVTAAADARHTRVYLTNGMLVTTQVANNRYLEAAAANWHALATFAGRFAKKEAALLVDIGSTTTDIIPLVNGVPASRGKTDLDRMLAGELVYTGVERSPVCAVVQQVPYRDQVCSVAQELFATTKDAYLILGEIHEDPTNLNTADNRPSTKAAARQRLARMIGADGEQFHHRDAAVIAEVVAKSQLDLLTKQLRRVVDQMPTKPTTAIVCGHGEFLANRMLQAAGLNLRTVSLATELGAVVSRCAPAHALAVLARESVGS